MASYSASSLKLKTTFAANGTFSVPAGYAISGIYMRNTTANAVTGGIRIGTTNGAADVVLAQAVGANAILGMADAAILLKFFSATIAQSLFVQAVTNWNSASVVVTLDLYYVGT